MDIGLQKLLRVRKAKGDFAASGPVVPQFGSVLPHPTEGGQFGSGGADFTNVLGDGDEQIVLAGLKGLREVAILLDLGY
jgi:hypothetical protein